MKFKSLLKIGILGMYRYFNVRKFFYIVNYIKKVKRENLYYYFIRFRECFL